MPIDPRILTLAKSPDYQGKTSAERAALVVTKRFRKEDHELKDYRKLIKCDQLGGSIADRDALISRFYAALYAAKMGWKVDQLAGNGWDFADPDMQASLDGMQAAGFAAEDVAKFKAVGVYLESDQDVLKFDPLPTAADFDAAVQQLLTDIITEHGAVVFNGDGYSDNWQIEAASRGLPNFKTTLDALPALIAPESIALFEKYGVFNERELESRYEVRMEQYALTIVVEAKLALEIGSTVILPAAVRYQTELAQSEGHIIALEPSAGIGRFVHAFDRAVWPQIKWTVIELSKVSASLLAAVRPDIRVVGEAQFLFHRGGQPPGVEVVQPDVERRQPPQHRLADATGGDDAHVQPLQVVRPGDAVGDVPAAVDHPFVARHEVAHQHQDLHDGVFGHADAVGVGHLGDGDAGLDRRVEVDMVGSDARG